MSNAEITRILTDLLLTARADRPMAVHLAHLWCIRNVWQGEKNPELLAVFAYATREARAWNQIWATRSAN